ncbi:MAG: secretin N-terminal domain-containing protein [Pyrinomonadaceae bacterium]
MKNSPMIRYCTSLLLLVSLFAPIAVLGAGDHKKNFKEGIKFEEAEEWDKAAESFALAVVESPKNPEYRLHLRRALFNASQMFMAKGRLAAEQKDYQAAYVAYRKAYAYDPVNELAKAEMEKMVRMQEAERTDDGSGRALSSKGVKIVPTALNTSSQPLPQRIEQLRDVVFPSGIELQTIIRELARELDFNVLFDTLSFRQPKRTFLDLRNVSRARALDYIFLQENLFFQKVGPRTIMVADAASRRNNFQQLVLRTFYLANASPKDVKTIVQGAIPVQPGRAPTIVLEDAATNSITIRDTAENIALIGNLISSLDKDRAEVVMDVAIYEVSKTDLLRLGNQIGAGTNNTNNQLNNLGGTAPGAVPFNGDFALGLARSIALGILVPSSVISAFQSKGNTKLLASTQIHAFNNEDSSARIGQRVPVRSASFAPVNGQNPGNNNNNFFGDVITYEQVGLTLKFKPIVFPNQDVQVAMEIESRDRAASADPLTPVFTERSIKGTARIQNNKTLLLASVAQGSESNGRAGLPVLGWIPIIGRLFATPTRDNSQVDIVIAVTPRVLRSPTILPEDEAERLTGSVGTPTSNSLETVVIQEERDELLAAARKLPKASDIQMPDRKEDTPVYVRDDSTSGATAQVNTATVKQDQAPVVNGLNLKPIDSSVKTLQIGQTSDTSGTAAPANNTASPPEPTSSVGFDNIPTGVKAGETYRIPVMIKASLPFRSALLGLKFDSNKFAVKSVAYGGVFGVQMEGKMAEPFLNQNGKTYVTLALPDGVVNSTNGTLAILEIQALADGAFDVAIDRDVLNFLTAEGKNFAIKLN